MLPSWSKLVQAGPSWFKLVQAGSSARFHFRQEQEPILGIGSMAKKNAKAARGVVGTCPQASK